MKISTVDVLITAGLGAVIISAFLFLTILAVPESNTDRYGQPLDQQGNFTAFGERWFCYKTGVTMDCSMVGKT